MEFAFTRGGCGWPSDCLDDPDRSPLAARLAEALAHAKGIWEAATPAERKEFWEWLCDEKA
jgi:hypothetical protein